ncbi:hypothetical protein [Streptomyces sp. NPDC014623]
MTWSTGLPGRVAGLLIPVVTAPAGVFEAVSPLPVRLGGLGAPSR